jgi:RNA polymerase sigma-70 factor (ECF subfamily)
VVLSSAASGGDEQRSRAALNQLCETYWRPVFAFVSRKGCSYADAQDLTQDFFVQVIEGNLLKLADPQRGRFRALLLTALQNFLRNAWTRNHARKRGGELSFISWDDWMAEAPSRLSISSATLDSLPPERLFDLRWAATVTERALSRLREECEAKGRRRLFDTLSASLATDRNDVSYAKMATELGIPETAVKKLLHRIRLRYRELLRHEVAHTVASPEEVNDEIRHLCAALAAAGA